MTLFGSLHRTIYSLWLFLASLDLRLSEVECTSAAEIDRHLEMGVQMLAKGQLHDALSHFHAAIDGDPSNYLSYYRRATVYLALGRSRTGLQDLDEVIRLKPDFTAARAQRGGVLVKLGRLEEAHIDLENVKCPWDASLRELRAEAYEAVGDIMSAIADVRVITKLVQDNTEGYMRLSNLYYSIGDVEQSLSEIRECLKLDPDHKECFQFYKKVKKVNKFNNDAQEQLNNKEYEECIASANKILRDEPEEEEVRFLAYDKLCQCNTHVTPNQAITFCQKALNIKEEPRLYCEMADANIADEMFDEAVRYFQKALDIDENLQRAKEGLERAQKLKKQASKRDYYKILGVRRTANKKEISKAYRSLAQKWHPDHYDGEEKKKAEKMFIDIAAAKEVLTDDEMRAKFDNGEDPLDPEQQQGGPGGHGFNPFQHFHFHHGGFPGGGFQGGGFKFHFN
ncbi:dnaJ homolog subfamily C member 3-like isoform X2 [Portunus trituberculatus]|uniref:dnaJ homolog subfamily C member 3-like isoform X2 n=1 Tax=Portunus trituberculatus TaxID=210409 RepID=UPI001E1CC9D8|nr:dnaJ homolog subfamily C member 3-like isoform X2 [Portunus trituberculatus]